MAELIMLVGLSGSGKSEVAKDFAEKTGGTIFSSSEIRKELNDNSAISVSNYTIHEELQKRVIEHLRNGGTAIYDATNLRMKPRKGLLHKLQKIDCTKSCVVVMSSIEDCQAELKKIGVPVERVMEQAKMFQVPHKYEGWDYVTIYQHKGSEYKLEDIDFKLKGIAHDNKHHRLSILEHMKEASRIYADTCSEFYQQTGDQILDRTMMYAVAYHDIGKLYTKTFIDHEGNKTDDAHYYGHHNVGAYMLLNSFLPSDVDMIEAAVLIQWHMEHYLRDEKGMRKLKHMLGEKLSGKLDLLHAIDKKAH